MVTMAGRLMPSWAVTFRDAIGVDIEVTDWYAWRRWNTVQVEAPERFVVAARRRLKRGFHLGLHVAGG
jgi:hypothetical protein